MSRNDFLALRVCFFALKKFTCFAFVASFLDLLEKRFVVVVIVCLVRLGSECLSTLSCLKLEATLLSMQSLGLLTQYKHMLGNHHVRTLSVC